MMMEESIEGTTMRKRPVRQVETGWTDGRKWRGGGRDGRQSTVPSQVEDVRLVKGGNAFLIVMTTSESRRIMTSVLMRVEEIERRGLN
jgi:hypothetical protein